MKPTTIRTQSQIDYRSGVLIGLRMAIVVAKRFGDRLTPEALAEALRIEADRIERESD